MNAKKCPTESRRIPSSATRTRSSRRSRYVFSSFRLPLRVLLYKMYCYIYLLIVPHKTTFVLEETVLECASSGESFSTAPRDSAFSRKKKKKERKNFHPFFVQARQGRRFFAHQNSSEADPVYYIIYSLYTSLIIIAYDEFDHR